MTKRLLITGGSGYLGRHLARRVARKWDGIFAYTFHSRDPLGWPQGMALDVRDGPAVARLVAAGDAWRGIGIDGAGQLPVVPESTGNTTASPAAGSRGLLYLWLGFIATLLILLTSVIGSIRLFTRRNET